MKGLCFAMRFLKAYWSFIGTMFAVLCNILQVSVCESYYFFPPFMVRLSGYSQ